MRGTYPSQHIQKLIDVGFVRSEAGIRAEQVQPSSLDLTISSEVYSVPGSMLPLPGERVRDLVTRFARRSIDLSRPQILDRGQVYLARLREDVQLPDDVEAYANNKSSTGRIDLLTRVLTDHNPRYDKIRAGYSGELWMEIIPKSFDVRLRAGDSLNQAIFYSDRRLLGRAELDALHHSSPLLFDPSGGPIDFRASFYPSDATGALLMTLDLDQDVVGYVSKRTYRPLDLAAVGQHDPASFFEPIRRPAEGALFLSQDRFYILSTYEYVSIPCEYAVEMLPYDTSAGEFRAHYAGFFDPGFGHGSDGSVRGTPAVLEVRPYEDDLIVRHRQPVCKMAYEQLVARPDKVYGREVKSHYAEQRGPRLSKYFAAT